MRVYGRTTDEFGNKKWVVVQTDANGSNDYVYLTALCQCIKLNLGESPFWSSFGIPAYQSVQQQLQPDFFVSYIQQYFAQFFASLTVAKISSFPPTYNINAMTHAGTILQASVAV